MTRIFIYREGKAGWRCVAVEFHDGDETPFAFCDLGLHASEEIALDMRDVYMDSEIRALMMEVGA